MTLNLFKSTRTASATAVAVLLLSPLSALAGEWVDLFNGNKIITTTIPADRHAAHSSGFIGLQIHGIKDGTAASGFVTARNEKTIELRNVAGAIQKLNAADVTKEEALKTSMMPPGLVNSLTIQEFASLIEYLQSLH